MTINVIDGPIIPKDGTLSNGIDCKSWTVIRIFVPPEWTGASLSFLLSPDNVLPYSVVCNRDGTERILQVQPNSMVLGNITPGGWLKFRSGTSEKQIPQRNAIQFRVGLTT